MPEIETTERFEQDFLHLPSKLQKKVLKVLRLLAENPRQPSLQTKPIQGARGLYEARIDQSCRMTYQRGYPMMCFFFAQRGSMMKR